jgi:hypothetical protein
MELIIITYDKVDVKSQLAIKIRHAMYLTSHIFI